MAKRWTNEEEEFVRDYYGKETTEYIGEILGRTPSSIKSKAEKLGIKSGKNKKRTTKEYRKEIKETHEVLEEYINNSTPILHKHIKCGYEWNIRPADVLKRKSCPKCNNKIKRTTEGYYKELKEANKDIICLDEYISNSTPILHKHIICGYEWAVAPYNVLFNTGCPKCANNIKRTTEEYKQEIKETNIIPLEDYINNRASIKHKHSVCGYIWNTPPAVILRTKACPKCSGTWRQVTDEQYKDNLNTKNKGVICLGNYLGAKEKILHKHSCGFEWLISPDNILHKSGCPKCAKKESKVEKELLDFIKGNYFGIIVENDRKILEGKEIDILLPELSIGIEFNGLYWHSESKGKYKSYHSDKSLLANKKGVQLIHIFENEWEYKKEIVKSRLLNFLGKNTRIYARKCSSKEVSLNESKEFLVENHLQGNIGSNVKLGLYYEEELVALMTIGKARYANYEHELLRFCTKLNTTVVGGASKLFKCFITNYNPNSVISYCDLRYGTGNLYENIGFEYSHTSKPNYWYFKGRTLESRIKYQKHKLKDMLKTFNPELTEYENMLNNGFNRIWDCGNKAYIWHQIK